MSITRLVEWCVEAAAYREPLHPSGMMLTHELCEIIAADPAWNEILSTSND